VNAIERRVRAVDAWQQRHAAPGFAFGIVKKFGDDRAGSLAALFAYYAFVAVFPLLLALTTVLGVVLNGHAALRQRVVTSALADFPIVGTQVVKSIHPLHGSTFTLVVGLLGLVWGGLGVTQVSQYAMAQVWNVPGVVRPNFVTRMVRGVAFLCTLGVGVAVTTVLASVSTFGAAATIAKVGGAVGSVVLNMGIFVLAFRITTPAEVETRSLVPGAVCAGIAWSVLQALGGYLVGHQLRHAQEVYGFFGSVLGLLSWLFLAAQVTLYTAELNVVVARRLWPRSIVQPPLTPADERTLAAIVRQEERRPEQTVTVSFDGDAPEPAKSR
jgi:YihY family inner membrane protein